MPKFNTVTQSWLRKPRLKPHLSMVKIINI